jgi:outer membrane protein TolC
MKKLFLGLMMFSMVSAVVAQPEAPPARSMSLVDCVQEALLHNLDLQIERYSPELSKLALQGNYGRWDPIFSASGQHNFARSGGGFSEITGTNTPSIVTDQNSFNSSLGGVLPWGLDYRLFGNIAKREFDPNDQVGGRVGFELTQPLLKNFWIDDARLRIAVARIGLQQSELGLRAQIMAIVTAVEKAYYDLIGARENVKVQEKALQLAEQLLAENKKRVEVGTLAPLDEKQAESQVALRRTDLLSAQQGLASAQNALRSLISDNYREIHEQNLEPTETLTAPEQVLNVQVSWSRGLAQRPDFLQAKLNIESQGYQLRFDRNQLFPQLNLVGGYARSAGGSAINEYSDGFAEFRQGNQPSHYYGATLTIPLSNRAARNTYRSSKMERERLTLELRRLERDILVGIDNNIIAARTSFERVDSTRQARLYAEAALDAEQKKLQNGKSTSFQVLQLQRDLTAASSAEIQALADYNKSLADLALGEGSTLERRKIDLEVK